jgi:HSP20 family protein
MNIAIREPWSLLNGFLGAAVPTSSSNVAFIPAVDVQVEKDRYVVKADLPGVTPEDIEITAEKGVLTLRGERKSEKREETAGYERLERVTGNFTRRFALPEDAQADAIKAKFTHGVLEVSIPKQPQVQPKRITVEAA